MLRPTRRTLILAGIGAPIAAMPAMLGVGLWPIWVVYVLAFALALAIELVLLTPRRQVTITVRPPLVMQVGAEHELLVEIQAPPRVRAIQVVPHLSGVVATSTIVEASIAGDGVHVPFVLRPTRRGPSHLHAIWARWQGPLGLLWNEIMLEQRRVVDTIPNTQRVRAHALRLRANPEYQTGQKVEHFLGDGSEFDALREFVEGFDRRSVDWKASARHRQMLCRQYRAERNHQVILAVDCGNRMSELIDGIPRVDHAIQVALQLAFTCLRTGDLVGVYGFDDKPRMLRKPQAGLQTMAVLQTALSELDYSNAETNYTLALTHLLTQVRRRSLVVLFTDFVDSITAELMVPNVLRLARRHLVLFVALRDTTLARAAAQAPNRMHDVHRAVIASEMIREREVVLERIRRAGAHVVDAAPAEVGSELISRYLDLKRREAV